MTQSWSIRKKRTAERESGLTLLTKMVRRKSRVTVQLPEGEGEGEGEGEKERVCSSSGGGDSRDGYTDTAGRDCMLNTDTVHGRQRGGSAHQQTWDPRHGRALSTSAHRPILTASSRVFTAAA